MGGKTSDGRGSPRSLKQKKKEKRKESVEK